jgi:hypothetical protein
MEVGIKESPGFSPRLCENWGKSGREGRIDNDAAFSMSYIRGEDREQASFLPARIDDYVGAEALGVAAERLDTELEGRFRSYALRGSARCRVRLASGKKDAVSGRH